jgi:hypothetical protein
MSISKVESEEKLKIPLLFHNFDGFNRNAEEENGSLNIA